LYDVDAGDKNAQILHRSRIVVTSRAVRIELNTDWVLCRASYRVHEYSTDTGSVYQL